MFQFDFTFARKPELLQGVYAMGFNKPSKIQVKHSLQLIDDIYNQKPIF